MLGSLVLEGHGHTGVIPVMVRKGDLTYEESLRVLELFISEKKRPGGIPPNKYLVGDGRSIERASLFSVASSDRTSFNEHKLR